MARTTVDLVEGVLLKDYDTVNSPPIAPFIEWAEAFTDRVVECATRKGVTLSDVEQELICRWLACHAYAMSDATYAEKATGRAKGKFTGTTGMSLDATRYGQMAQSLDPSGCVRSIGMGRGRVQVQWLGRPPSEQTDYVDRD